jgi:para-aminobenzoate synthetase/4-amino-4-deoxychorismate lyase
MPAFALLDDRHATAAAPTSRLYEHHVRTHRCVDPAGLEAMWGHVDADLRGGLHAVVLADYEWGAKLLKAGNASLAVDDSASLRVLMFERVSKLSYDEAGAWLGALEGSDDPAPAGAIGLQDSVDRASFIDAIERIHEAIRAGETYQVNYTYRMDGAVFGSPVALYRRLRARQPVAYGAFIALPDHEVGATHVLSCSPELFLRHDAGLLTARPMKGTAPRIAAPESDSETARLLSIDIKNRAENLMIVDLLRNDLGRLAEIGSVTVPALFAIEPYSTVFQMTSTVQARLRAGVAFPELLRAVFPCGSITGAPKHHTMQIIAGLETTPRGLYCGAIGWLDRPEGAARIGDFCLSVAIRTLTLQPDAAGLRPVRLGVGAGIVIDSRAADEYDECRLKARFLTALDPGLELFETMLWTPAAGLAHRERHLARLAASAAHFGFGFDRDAVDDGLARCLRRLARAGGAARVRLALAKSGALTLTDAPLAPLPDGDALLRVSDSLLRTDHPLASHKTTARRAYDDGVRRAEATGAFDTLFFNQDGRLVEGGRSNVFLRIDGRWWTPPLADGVLPGIMRALLLENAAWGAQERSLTRADLAAAQDIVVCNALRGPLTARLLAEHAAPAA